MSSTLLSATSVHSRTTALRKRGQPLWLKRLRLKVEMTNEVSLSRFSVGFRGFCAMPQRKALRRG
jgi:hypothetical protein